VGRYLCLFFIFLLAQTALAQEDQDEGESRAKAVDSLAPGHTVEGVQFEEVEKLEPANALAPSKPALYSTVLPGLGQIYNKRYWKAPLVWGAIGTGIYAYSYNNTNYRSARKAFKRRMAGFADDQFWDLNGDGTGPDISDEALEEAQENTQRDRDLALVITIALYALNIIDANVDAHLKQYNVDDRLALDFKPFMDINPISHDPVYGMALVVKF